MSDLRLDPILRATSACVAALRHLNDLGPYGRVSDRQVTRDRLEAAFRELAEASTAVAAALDRLDGRPDPEPMGELELRAAWGDR